MKRIFNVLITVIVLFYVGASQAAKTCPTPSDKPFPPFHIAGNIYYVGDEFQADYLIVTPKGNILINSGFSSDLPKVKASIKKLGFNYKDTKILLISHAHDDHAGGMAAIKKETGARYMVMAQDVPTIESGGKDDFNFGDDPTKFYPATKVDRILHDGDKVQLGNTTLVAHLTPGHTKGCTTWTMKVNEKGKTYNVVIVGGPFVGPGFKLVNNAKYPNILTDYEHGFQVLNALPVDIFLGAHGMFYNLDKKYSLMEQGKPHPFIDPKGYKQMVQKAQQDLNKKLAQQESDKAKV